MMAKTNWQMGDTVQPADLNQIGQEINKNTSDIANIQQEIEHLDLSAENVTLDSLDFVSTNVKDGMEELHTYLTQHESNTSNPHNVTTAQVNSIEAKNANDLPITYPRGITTFFTDDANQNYPSAFGTVLTYAYNQNRIVQHFTDLNGLMYYRVGSSNQWGAWKTLLTNDLLFSTAGQTFYVDPNGSDDNPGTINSPFQTLSKAVSIIPSVIQKNHTYTIYLNEGTWDEELVINGVTVLGRLDVRGTSAVADNHKIERLHVEKVIGEVRFLNFKTTKKIEYGIGSLSFYAAFPNMYLENIVSIGSSDLSETGSTGSINLLADRGSIIYATRCVFSNRRYGIRSNWNSRVFSRENLGNSNDFGVAGRFGGIVQTFATQPAGTANNFSVESGAIVVRPSGIVLGT